MKELYTMRPLPHGVRQRLRERIASIPDGWVVSVSEPKRSLVQNSKLWAMLTDVSTQVVHYGLKLSAEDWKDVLTASLRKEMRTVPNVEGNGLVVLGMKTSTMSVRELGELIELVYAFGASKDIKWSEPEEAR